MPILRSFWRKSVATAVAATGFVSLYEVTTLDSKYAARQAVLSERQVFLPDTTSPTPGVRLTFSATAYCKGLQTKSGVAAQRGVAAADPDLLPVGSVVEIDSLSASYNGIYTVLDTGPAIQGREIDLYMWSCYEALEFGRRPVHLNVLRLGWNPRATSPPFMSRVLKRPGPPQPLSSDETQ